MDTKYTGPFVRPTLTATKNGWCDPRLIVKTWLDTIEEIVKGVSGASKAHQAFDLLATFSKLRRTRPEILDELKAADEMSAAESLIQKGGKELVRLALTVPNLDAWMNSAETLKLSFEDMSVEPETKAGFAGDLIRDFDDVACLAEMLPLWKVEDSGFLNEYFECKDWLENNSDSFLAAGVYIQALSMTLRPSLRDPFTDLEGMLLHRTTTNIMYLLDELVNCEAGTQGLPQLSAETATRLIQRATKRSAQQ